MRMSVERPVIERAIQLLERGWAMDAYAVDKAGRTVFVLVDACGAVLRCRGHLAGGVRRDGKERYAAQSVHSDPDQWTALPQGNIVDHVE